MVTWVLMACGPSSEEESTRNLETGVVKVSIGGHHFDVPLRYLYSQAMEKHQHWPVPSPDRVQVDGLVLSVLMPDFRPYYKADDARWNVLGHGERIQLSLSQGRHDWYAFLLKTTQDPKLSGRFYQKGTDHYQLVHYAGGALGDLYFARDGRSLYLSCLLETPPPNWKGGYSPSCSVKSNYKSGLVLEYYYSRSYLPQWSEIDNGLKNMLDGFYRSTEKPRR